MNALWPCADGAELIRVDQRPCEADGAELLVALRRESAGRGEQMRGNDRVKLVRLWRSECRVAGSARVEHEPLMRRRWWPGSAEG